MNAPTPVPCPPWCTRDNAGHKLHARAIADAVMVCRYDRYDRRDQEGQPGAVEVAIGSTVRLAPVEARRLAHVLAMADLSGQIRELIAALGAAADLAEETQ